MLNLVNSMETFPGRNIGYRKGNWYKTLNHDVSKEKTDDIGYEYLSERAWREGDIERYYKLKQKVSTALKEYIPISSKLSLDESTMNIDPDTKTDIYDI